MLRGESQTGVWGYWVTVVALTEDVERGCGRRSVRTQASMAYILHMERDTPEPEK